MALVTSFKDSSSVEVFRSVEVMAMVFLVGGSGLPQNVLTNVTASLL